MSAQSLPPIVAVIGGKGSGKDTAADYLAQKIGGSRFSTSTWLREYVKESGVSNEELYKAEERLRGERGWDFFVDEALKLPGRPVVISGLRLVEALDRVHQEGGVVIHIEADRQLRHKRVIARKRPGEVVAPVWVDNYVSKRVEAGGPPREQLTEKADYVIDNNGSSEQLRSQLDRLIQLLLTRAGPHSVAQAS